MFFLNDESVTNINKPREYGTPAPNVNKFNIGCAMLYVDIRPSKRGDSSLGIGNV